MDAESNYNVVLFYSLNNPLSLKVKDLVNEVIAAGHCQSKLSVKEEEFDYRQDASNKYGVTGTPVIIIFKNGMPSMRHFGEIERDELEELLEGIC